MDYKKQTPKEVYEHKAAKVEPKKHEEVARVVADAAMEAAKELDYVVRANAKGWVLGEDGKWGQKHNKPATKYDSVKEAVEGEKL